MVDVMKLVWHEIVSMDSYSGALLYRIQEKRSCMKSNPISCKPGLSESFTFESVLDENQHFTSCGPLPGSQVHSPWPLAQGQDLVVSSASDGSDHDILQTRSKDERNLIRKAC